MKIALLTIPNETGSLHIMCRDLKAELEPLGHEVTICTTYQECAKIGPDLLLNFEPKQYVYVQSAANRWWRCGQLINVWAMQCCNYTAAMMAGYLGTMFETPMIAISPACQDELVGRARSIFNPANVRKLGQNLHLIPYGVRDIFSFGKKQDLDRWICPITRVSISKNFPDHQDATIKAMAMFRLQHLGEPRTTTYISESKSFTRLHSTSKHDAFTTDGYEVKPIILDRAEYAEALKQYAFAMVTCEYESFGLYYIELLLSGVIVLFRDCPWVHRLLPGYKFVAGLDDLPGMALHVRTHYDEAFAYIEQEVLPFIRERYLLKRFTEKLLEVAPTLHHGTGPEYQDFV